MSKLWLPQDQDSIHHSITVVPMELRAPTLKPPLLLKPQDLLLLQLRAHPVHHQPQKPQVLRKPQLTVLRMLQLLPLPQLLQLPLPLKLPLLQLFKSKHQMHQPPQLHQHQMPQKLKEN